MKNPVLTLSQTITTDEKDKGFSQVSVYKGMSDAQIAQFQAELSAAFTTVLQSYAAYLAGK